MHPRNAACLSAARLDLCVLANNHVLDWGVDGLVETLDTLRGIGIASAGAEERDSRTESAIELMGGFAERTGITSDHPQQRYLHALDLVARSTRDPRSSRWSRELATRAHAARAAGRAPTLGRDTPRLSGARSGDRVAGDISEVMLATSLAPDGCLLLPALD